MRLLIYSGNRADWSGLEWLGNVLTRAGHDVEIYKFWECYEGKPNTPSQVAELAGLSFHEASNRLGSVDLVFLLGDRYEVLAAAQAAYLMKVPIAHIGGGDITLGSDDDAMRDAISMLTSLHFTTNNTSSERLFRMGTHANRRGSVYTFGSPAIDRIMSLAINAPQKVSREMSQRIIVSVHPSLDTPEGNICGAVLQACKEFGWREVRLGHDVEFDLIAPNADAGNGEIEKQMRAFCEFPFKSRCHENLPPDEYLMLLSDAAMIVGNSSSGIYEAPVLGVPTVNVGARQAGRAMAPSVAFSSINPMCIYNEMVEALTRKRPDKWEHFGHGRACERIAQVLSGITDPKALLNRHSRGLSEEALRSEKMLGGVM